jgi:hypothetical protein
MVESGALDCALRSRRGAICLLKHQDKVVQEEL